MDRLLQPPLHLQTLSAQPLSPADAHAHLAAFLEAFQARARDGQAGASSAAAADGEGDDAGSGSGAAGGGAGGAVEGSLLARLVEGLEHELAAKKEASA
jgi:hypothetical protein